MVKSSICTPFFSRGDFEPHVPRGRGASTFCLPSIGEQAVFGAVGNSTKRCSKAFLSFMAVLSRFLGFCMI